jgi:hypothetical protein
MKEQKKRKEGMIRGARLFRHAIILKAWQHQTAHFGTPGVKVMHE